MILADLTLSAPKTIAYIQKIREVLPQTSVVILSHVNDMDIIRMAYEKGAELLIHKPFNEIEVRNVLHNMEMSRAMQWMIVKARNDFSAGAFSWESNVRVRKMQPEELETDYNQSIRRLKSILQEIGILSEAGSKDIIRIVRYLIEEDLDIRDITVSCAAGWDRIPRVWSSAYGARPLWVWRIWHTEEWMIMQILCLTRMEPGYTVWNRLNGR